MTQSHISQTVHDTIQNELRYKDLKIPLSYKGKDNQDGTDAEITKQKNFLKKLV